MSSYDGSTSADWPGYTRTRRMREQRWLVDLAIRQVGVDWDQGRTRYTARAAGSGAQADFARIRENVRTFADIHPAFANAARRRERLAHEAEESGRVIEAREHFITASILWGNAEWPLFGLSPTAMDCGARKVDCYAGYVRHAAHRIEIVEIPHGSVTLPGYLHLPPSGGPPFPTVVHIGGMDAFKEHRTEIYGDSFLERGIASLAVDLPGQGECLTRGIFLTPESTARAGSSILSWVRTHRELDGSRIALSGNSFGSFWATEIAAASQDLAGCAVTGVIHEPGMHTIFEEASPTFKARFMYMTDMVDEDQFDRFAQGLDLMPLTGSVTCPYMVIAGQDDELSPLTHTFRLLASIPSPVRLVVYQGERHSIGGGLAGRLGPNPKHLAAQWLSERLEGQDAAEEFQWIDLSGVVDDREPFWRDNLEPVGT